ncbi:MAG: trimethylamine methyltransferase family protein, partial [Eubacterium sp.]
QVHACGLIDSMNSIGYEKFILDEEKIESLKHLMQGYEVNDSTIMFDSILETGPSGQHFERTKKSYRTDFIMPKLSIRDNHNSWIQAGSPSAESLASDVWKQRLKEYRLPDFSKDQLQILETLIPDEYI